MKQKQTSQKQTGVLASQLIKEIENLQQAAKTDPVYKKIGAASQEILRENQLEAEALAC